VEAASFNISFDCDFWTRYRALRALQHRLWATWIGYAFFAGVPTVAFAFALVQHWDLSRRGAFGLPGWAAFGASYVFIFIFFPLLQMFQLWTVSRRNRTMLGRQQQSLTSAGVTASGESFNTTVNWQAIHKAVETKQFFFLFFSARGAFFIPKAQIGSESDLIQLRSVLQHYLHDKAHLRPTA
jgi:hypothetical protein